jgi:hypothetical protein
VKPARRRPTPRATSRGARARSHRRSAEDSRRRPAGRRRGRSRRTTWTVRRRRARAVHGRPRQPRDRAELPRSDRAPAVAPHRRRATHSPTRRVQRPPQQRSRPRAGQPCDVLFSMPCSPSPPTPERALSDRAASTPPPPSPTRTTRSASSPSPSGGVACAGPSGRARRCRRSGAPARRRARCARSAA